MSTAPRRKPATYEDLLRVPEHMVAEILDGELFASPRPRFLTHARPPASEGCSSISSIALREAAKDRAAGGFSTSRSIISKKT
jgi:hypothetical protein